MSRWFALAALLLGAVGLAAQTAGPTPNSGTAILTGRVLAGDDGSPIAAATVALSGGSLPRFDALRVLTDAQGRFYFSDVSAGTYELNASKPGWMTGALGRSRPSGTSTPVVVSDGQRQPDLEIRLWRYAVITGRVTDSTGEAIVGADIRAFRVSYTGGHQQATFIIRVRTDDRGLYRFASLEPGDYIVCAPAAVTSEPSGFSGLIRSQQGDQPHAYLQTMTGVGAVAMTLDRSTGYAGVDRWSISSTADMPSPPPAAGPWLTFPTTFALASLTRANATLIHAQSGQERAGVDLVLTLTQTFQVSGMVTGPDGPAAYHALHLLPADSADVPLVDVATAITDSTGAFTFFGVPAGSYVARVVRTPWPGGSQRLGIGSAGNGAIQYVFTMSSGPGAGAPAASTEPLLHATVPVVVADRDVRDLTLALQTGPRVSGRVQFDGSAAPPAPDALPQVQVTLERADGQQFTNVLPARVAATGQFTTPSTWPGKYLVRVSNPPRGWTLKSAMTGNRDASESALDLVSDIDDVVLLFTDKALTLTGTVQVDSSMARSGASVVVLFPTDRSGWRDYGRGSRRVRSTSVAANGAFSMPAPPEGEYFLIAIPDVDAADWQNPVFLEQLAGRADRVRVVDGQSIAHPLTLRQVMKRDQ